MLFDQNFILFQAYFIPECRLFLFIPQKWQKAACWGY